MNSNHVNGVVSYARDQLAQFRSWSSNWVILRYQELATGHDAMITAPSGLTELLLEIAEPAS